MKSRMILLVAIVAVGSTDLFSADAPPTNFVFSASGITNVVRVPVVTNIVAGEAPCIETDHSALPKLRVSSEGMTNIVNTLVSSGEFCRVRGHLWGDYFSGVVLAYHDTSGSSYRQCQVCKTVQTRTPGAWK